MRELWSDRPNCSHNVSQKVKRIRRFSDHNAMEGGPHQAGHGRPDSQSHSKPRIAPGAIAIERADSGKSKWGLSKWGLKVLVALGNLQKCVGGFLLYKFWRIFPGIFLEDFSGHFFPQK